MEEGTLMNVKIMKEILQFLVAAIISCFIFGILGFMLFKRVDWGLFIVYIFAGILARYVMMKRNPQN
ncbi:hypothetical protein GCM10007096_18590 [Pullulanibacillus pueri]|uniref:Uncharacterized protein n=1 Tax=Pullulanibacillus pueri TaxID=1437324 RepID=A0A8J2ZVR1_9BACL|nr:hypothetical protein GCM10007096_18590 [Pullulanibacillus pueri]